MAGDDDGIQGGQRLAARRPEGRARPCASEFVERQPGEYVVTSITGASPALGAACTQCGGHLALRPLSEGRHALQNHPVVRQNPFLVLLATLFVVLGGVYAVMKTPLDALPDLSDVQVIVYTEYPGQAPQVVEDQVTIPLTTAMLAVPKSKVVRGFSFFGASFVYVIFEDGTDIYWARGRVLERLNSSGPPAQGCRRARPDATGVGWVYQYALLAKEQDAGRTAHDPGLVRALCAHQGARRGRGGVAGRLRPDLPGHRRPAQAQGYGIPSMKVSPGHPRLQPRRRRPRGRDGRRPSSWCAAGLRPARMADDIEAAGRPARRHAGADPRHRPRRGWPPTSGAASAELNGEGEVVSGIAMSRFGQNALEVIHKPQGRSRVSAGLPAGVDPGRLRPLGPDPSRHRHPQATRCSRKSLIVAAGMRDLPDACALGAGGHPDAAGGRADLVHRHGLLGMNSNIMSLGGIAIAIGAMVDAAIVMIENAHKLHLERPAAGARWKGPCRCDMLDACKEVGPGLFFRC